MTIATLESFLAWKHAARPGQRFEYHRGFFPRDLNPDNHEAREIFVTRRAVIDAYLTGNFELVQRRHGPGDFAYFIVRRAVRDTAPRIWIRQEHQMIKGSGSGHQVRNRRRAA